MEVVLSVLIGYLFGCVNMSYIIGRIKGFDIREKGSNNAGASNAVVTMGFKAGIVVGVWDILKAFLAAETAKYLFPNLTVSFILAGAGAVFGHIFPFWMGFRGGKGLASLLGLTLATDWRVFLICGVAIIVVTLITDYIAVGTLVTAVGYPIYMIIVWSSLLVTVVMGIILITMVYKHFINVKRIVKGEEIGLSQTLGKKKDKH